MNKFRAEARGCICVSCECFEPRTLSEIADDTEYHLLGPADESKQCVKLFGSPRRLVSSTIIMYLAGKPRALTREPALTTVGGVGSMAASRTLPHIPVIPQISKLGVLTLYVSVRRRPSGQACNRKSFS